MHAQARYFIRTALAYLLAAFLVGGLVLADQGRHCSLTSLTRRAGR